MTKNEFLEQLDEIIASTIFIGNSQFDLQKEISNNIWGISLSSELTKVITAEDLSTFIEKVISNRKEQIRKRKPSTGIIFYLWVDEQAKEMRFNIISNYETGLPFDNKVAPVNSYSDIIELFLNSTYDDDVEINARSHNDRYKKTNAQELWLQVYCVEL